MYDLSLLYKDFEGCPKPNDTAINNIFGFLKGNENLDTKDAYFSIIPTDDGGASISWMSKDSHCQLAIEFDNEGDVIGSIIFCSREPKKEGGVVTKMLSLEHDKTHVFYLTAIFTIRLYEHGLDHAVVPFFEDAFNLGLWQLEKQKASKNEMVLS
jgi:hypothetical protein